MLWLAGVIIGIRIGSILAQTGGTTLTGTYICVPTGFCKSSASSEINPRIVTTGAICPEGQVACFNQGTGSQCGQRSVTLTSFGDGVADAGAYPWLAYLQDSSDTFAGGGVLLDNYHVLTAAHKVADNVPTPASLAVLMGVFDPAQTTDVQKVEVSKIVLHPQFNPTTLMDDIALLRLASPINITQTNVNTACLPAAGTSYIRQRCVVAGWGQTSFNVNDAPTNPMKQVFMNVIDYNTCRASFAQLINVDQYLDPSGEICAGGEAMKDACTQDGGSPLACPDATGRFSIAGLVIWGKNCGQPGVYGVYVSVPFYRSWIDATITSLIEAAAAA